MDKFERKLSHTSLATFRRCKMRYKWGYLDDYDPLPSRGLMMGGTGHVALGAWYKALAEEDDTDRAAEIAFKAASDRLAEYEEQHEQDFNDIWDDLAVVLDRYFEWALENDDFKAYAIEHKFELEMSEFTVIGYIDGIVERANGTHWLLEHKFNKQVRTKHLELDPQVSLYMLAARASGFDIRGVLYNVLRTTITGKAETEPVVRLPVFRNNEGLKQIVLETINQMREVRDFHKSNGATAYRNPTRDCSWDCGFYQACLAMNDDGDPYPALRDIPVKGHDDVEIGDDI